jgi:hypothetical protein
MAMTFRKGDRVHVEFDATVGDTDIASFPASFPTGTRRSAYTTFVTDDHGFEHFVYLTDATAETAKPGNWPPRAGEIWQTPAGQQYFVRENRAFTGHLVLESKDALHPAGHAHSYSTGIPEELDEFRALNPRRIFPEG